MTLLHVIIWTAKEQLTPANRREASQGYHRVYSRLRSKCKGCKYLQHCAMDRGRIRINANPFYPACSLVPFILHGFYQLCRNIYAFKPYSTFFRGAETEKVYAPVPDQSLVYNSKLLMYTCSGVYLKTTVFKHTNTFLCALSDDAVFIIFGRACDDCKLSGSG